MTEANIHDLPTSLTTSTVFINRARSVYNSKKKTAIHLMKSQLYTYSTSGAKDTWYCLYQLQSSACFACNSRKITMLFGSLVWTPNSVSDKQKNAWYCLHWLQSSTRSIHNSRNTLIRLAKYHSLFHAQF